jgi:diguanylate cyclase (GGDEF)-like protein/PAS domain S-box-containing protein
MRHVLSARSSSLKAFAIVAVIAILQFSGLALLTATQSDSAHIIDISGAQRMRSQRVALLVTAAHDGRPLSGWRSELEETLAALTATSRELAKRTSLRAGPIGGDGETELSQRLGAYEHAARRLEIDPADSRASDVIRSERLPVLALLDAAVHVRAARFTNYNRWLVGAMLLGLFLQLGAIALAWYRVMLPATRRAELARVKLETSQGEFRSLFEQNPDSIAIYDDMGTLLRGNHAAIALLGFRDDALVGRNFSQHVAADESARVQKAFAEVLRGTAISLETVFSGAGNERIAVDASLFPRFVNGRITGVIGVAKDVRDLNAAKADAREQSERVAELYELSAGHGTTWEEQVDRTMRLSGRRLGFDLGFFSELHGDSLALTYVFGPAGVKVGETLPVGGSLSRHAIAAHELWAVDDLRESPFREGGTDGAYAWGSIVVVPLEIDGTTFGTFALGSEKARTVPLTEADRHYTSLVATLLTSGIERALHERKLDALAFFDLLTGLPNRTQLVNTLTELIAATPRVPDSLAIHYLDLDFFKAVNDGFGHAAGDAALRIAAKRMRGCVRGEDMVARMGGDEFVVIQHLSNGRSDATALAKRLIATIDQPFLIGDATHTIGACVGISFLEPDDADVKTLLERADVALYRAKREGRNRLMFAS